MRKPHALYRLALYCYPKTYRQHYGEQMIQTLDDMLAESQSASGRFVIKLRVGAELPFSVAHEYIQSIGETDMQKLAKSSNKRLVIAGAAVACTVAVGVGLYVLQLQPDIPMTVAQAQATKPERCIVSVDKGINIDGETQSFIFNTVATQINNVPAGTDLTVDIATYNGTDATGSSVYQGSYGSYNFKVKKQASDSSNGYTGGWVVTKIAKCV